MLKYNQIWHRIKPTRWLIKFNFTKSTWDKAALAATNANSKDLNVIFFGVSPDKFHWISHVTIAKEAWKILETTHEGTKKVKDTKL